MNKNPESFYDQAEYCPECGSESECDEDCPSINRDLGSQGYANRAYSAGTQYAAGYHD